MCADISRDPNNCGQCGRVCNAANGETCMPQGGGLGMCVVVCGGAMCQQGQACCSGACVDVQFDDANCGFCGNACDTSSGNVFCFNGCCFDFTTNQCLPNGDGGVPDGGFPFPDAFPFPDGFPFPFDGGSAPG